MEQSRIRNFSIIAHIDHGKSTIADRILQLTNAVEQRDFHDQMLDDMPLERERGITIKSRTVRLNYTLNNIEYELNLIDTPGHVDFSYEVSRSLAACEGALLVVDATQGIQAQTLANLYLAIDNNLEIIPVINKIDLPGADIERTTEQIERVGLDTKDIIHVSAKSGEGIPLLLESIVTKLPSPVGEINKPLRALIFDSHYDTYRGIVCYFRVIDGSIKDDMKIKFMSSKTEHEITELGYFSPVKKEIKSLIAGEVGYCIAGIKFLKDVKIGDTITDCKNADIKQLPGYKEVKPVVFCGFYPIDSNDYSDLKESLAKLQLNDVSFTFEPETSAALGFGFKCGFLGLLHLEIIQERLEREFGIPLIMTAPSVLYKIIMNDGAEDFISSAINLPNLTEISELQEPYINATIIVQDEFIGNVLQLCQTYRGEYIKMEYIGSTTVIINYLLPLGEIIVDFYDKLKSATKGYATFDYEISEYKKNDLVKLDILINGESVDALSNIVHRETAFPKGKSFVKKLKEVMPRQQFALPIQAAIGNRIIARETVKAYRKNVLARCYGGDVTRKRKLLEKQKEGKKKMKRVGDVDIPQEAFMTVLKYTRD